MGNFEVLFENFVKRCEFINLEIDLTRNETGYSNIETNFYFTFFLAGYLEGVKK